MSATVAAARRRGLTAPVALGLYAVLAVLLFGLPVLAHPQRILIAQDATDSSLFVWFYAWWPHALLHGMNPLVTHELFWPSGFNLQWTTPMPLPSVLLAPVTLLASPELTYNLIQLAAPALSAWTMFLLVRELTARPGPALVAGYAFGFSPYVLAHLSGGPFLALVPMLPLAVLLFLRRLEERITPRRYVIGQAATMAAQFLISTEVTLTAVVFAVLGLILAGLLLPERRAALVRATALTALAGAIALVLLAPFWLTFLLGHHYPPTGRFAADPRSFVVPPHFLAAFGTRYSFLDSGEGYLGLPLLALIVWWLWEHRSSRTAWWLVLCVAIAKLASLGSGVYGGLPIFRYAIPIRFAVFATLPAAVILGRFLARGGRWRCALSALVVASFAPLVGDAVWHTHAADPPFFAAGTYRSYLQPGDHVLAVPAIGPSERWQADTGFRFRLVTGYAGAYPKSYARLPIWTTLLTGHLTADSAAGLRAFVTEHDVTVIVVDPSVPGPWRRLFAALGVPPRPVGGVLLYRLRNLSRSSGRSST